MNLISLLLWWLWVKQWKFICSTAKILKVELILGASRLTHVIDLVPQVTVYNNLGQDCVSAGCSVDLFVFNNSYIDMATIGQVSRLSGGEIYKYTYFQVCEMWLRNLRWSMYEQMKLI